VALVVDASALAYATVGKMPGSALLRERLIVDTCHAPHLIDAEFGSALRRLVHIHEVGLGEARAELIAGPRLIDRRYAVDRRLAERAWAMRDNLTFYDALYVALAWALRLRLLTADVRLAQSPGLDCAVELVG
jgi:predicted nucleic acid-binding protein